MHPQILRGASLLQGMYLLRQAKSQLKLIDNHISTDTSEISDDSFHLSETESETNDEEIQNLQCNNILAEINKWYRCLL